MRHYGYLCGVLAALAIGLTACSGEPTAPEHLGETQRPNGDTQVVTQLGLSFRVPADWEVGIPPGSDWCASEVPPTAPGLIPPIADQWDLAIGCDAMPGEYQVPHVVVAPHVDVSPGEVAVTLPDAVTDEKWPTTEPTERKRIAAKPAVGSDHTPSQGIAEEYVRYTERYGPLDVTVFLPAAADDQALATTILDSVTPVAVSQLGCPTVATAGPSGDIGQHHDETLVVCHYVSLAALSETNPVTRATTYPAYPAFLIGERTVDPTAAANWVTAVEQAPAGPGPTIPANECMPQRTFLHVLSDGEALAEVRYDGCENLGVHTADTLTALTASTCQPLFGGLVTSSIGAAPVSDLCFANED
ncbi:MAG: hypothetical protein Q4Q03_02200 [Bowdeniella nasicola]|nr:hypothetical protein [Bowdeniella nasicola]